MTEILRGTVTFLFTDIEGSTQLWEGFPEAMPAALAAHDDALRGAIEGCRGAVVKSTGDGVLAAFASAADGLAAALAAQRSLRAQEPAGEDAPRIRARMGLHSGEAQARDGDYFGGTLNRAARLMAIGHGGQVLLSEATCALVRERMPGDAALVDMGAHRLKDLTQPERVYQLTVLDLPREFPPLKSLSAYRHNLPVQLTSFIGREAELSEVTQLLKGTRLLTLIGPGGTGKTRLSLQAAADLVEQYPDGVWFVEFAPVTDPAQVEQTIAGVFGVHEQPGVTLARALEDYMRYKQVLLVLDNCEHLIGAVAQAAQRLLQAGPQVKIISSSREGLTIAGETIYQVPSLGLPPEGGAGLDALMQTESARLFVERAQAVMPSFTLTAENAESVCEICRRVDGIPLAIELAAVRVRLLTPAQIAARLRDHFRLLVGGSRTALPRQQTLQALIDWSWDLLGEEERAILRRLSVFASGWTLEAAEAVLPAEGESLDVLEGLGQLVNKSLVVVRQRADESRYRLLETIRQYARDKLTAAGESAAVRERHARCYARLAADYEPHTFAADMRIWIERFEVDVENFGAAYDWLAESDPLNALRLAIATTFAFQRVWRFPECDRRLTDSMARVRRLPPGTNERQLLLARGLAWLCTTCMGRGDYRRAREAGREGIELAGEMGEQATLAFILSNLAVLDSFQSNWAMGEAEAREAIEIHRRGGSSVAPMSQLGVSIALSTQAFVRALRGGDTAGATALADESMRWARTNNNPWVIGMTAMNVARVADIVGDLPTARALTEQAKANFDLAGDIGFSRMMAADMAHILRRSGLREEAQAAYRRSIRWFQESGNRGGLAHQLECFGMLALDARQLERAARLFGAAQFLRDQAEAPRLNYERGEYDAAQARLRSAMDPAALERAWNEGTGLSPEQAVAFALE